MFKQNRILNIINTIIRLFEKKLIQNYNAENKLIIINPKFQTNSKNKKIKTNSIQNDFSIHMSHVVVEFAHSTQIH